MTRTVRTPEERRAWLLDIAAKKRALADEWDDYPDVANMYRADADIAEADAQAIPRSTP